MVPVEEAITARWSKGVVKLFEGTHCLPHHNHPLDYRSTFRCPLGGSLSYLILAHPRIVAGAD